jgi:IS6 family transposase
VTIYRWVQTFTPAFIDAARPARHATGDRWFLDETYVKVAGRWIYLYRAIDQRGQAIDVLVSTRRDAAAARVFFARALQHGPVPVEIVDGPSAGLSTRGGRGGASGAARHRAVPGNNSIEADHDRLKARLRPMRGIKRLACARTIAAGHAFVQNLRRGHYAITADLPARDRIHVAFDELALVP